MIGEQIDDKVELEFKLGMDQMHRHEFAGNGNGQFGTWLLDSRQEMDRVTEGLMRRRQQAR